MDRAARALVIGTSRYSNALQFDSLPEVERDVRAVGAVLRAPNRGNFRDVLEVLDPTTVELARHIEQFLRVDVQTGEVAVVYYSGHGFAALGRLYLTGTDTNACYPASTGFMTNLLQEILPTCVASHVIIILDCCHAGRGASAIGIDRLEVLNDLKGVTEKKSGTYLISSSLPSESSAGAPDPDNGLSAFTEILIDGIHSGAADLGLDGEIDILELAQYIQIGIQEEQTPAISIHNATGGPPRISSSGRSATTNLAMSIVGTYAPGSSDQVAGPGNAVALESVHLISAWSFGATPAKLGLVGGTCNWQHPSLTGVDIDRVDVRPTIEQTEVVCDDYSTGLAGLMVCPQDERRYLGVAPGAELMNFDVLGGDSTAPISHIARAIALATQSGVSVLCVPFSISVDETMLMREVIRYAKSRDVLVCCAAPMGGGEMQVENTEDAPLYVAPYSETEGIASFSSHYTSDCVCAPGVDLWTIDSSPEIYQVSSGTGLSVAIASGIAALARGANPGLSPADTAKLMIDSSSPNHAGSNYPPLLHAQRAVSEASARRGKT